MPTFLDKDRKKKEWLRKERQREREEDGYADLLRQKRTLWRKLTRPLRLVKRNIVFPQTPGKFDTVVIYTFVLYGSASILVT